MKNVRKYMVEGVGSMFLVLAYGLIGGPFAIATMLAVLIYMGSHISGGHYNPAISLAVWLRGKMKSGQAWMYILFQIFGGLCAALIYWLVVGRRYMPIPMAGVAYWKIIFVEMLFTFFLAFVFLSVMTTKKVKANGMYGLIIGLSLLAIAFLGGIYNPAVVVGPHLIDVFFKGSAMRYMWVYLFGSFSGGTLAAIAFYYMYPGE
jgi:aquaporin Z